MSNAYLLIDFVHINTETKFDVSGCIVACYISSHTHGVWAHGTSSRLKLRANLVTMTADVAAMPIPNVRLIQHNLCSSTLWSENSGTSRL